MTSTAAKPTAIDENDLYTIVIYQNGPYVEGLYQQFHGGKPVESKVANDSKNIDSIRGKASGGGDVLGIIRLNADVDGGREWHNSQGASTTMTFDQAYLLHGVRKALRDKGLVQVVDSGPSFQALRPGNFVEYRASFEPNMLVTALDVMTPELVKRFANAESLKKNLKAGLPEAEHQHVLNSAHIAGEQAAAVFEALQREFRNETSLEFYGEVLGESRPAVSAVTICERSMFGGGDTDKLLDGEFRVLGKVVRVMNNGYSLMDRNKILSRLRPGAVEELEGKLAENENLNRYMDLELALQYTGFAFKVIPIAIFV
jgi:hypothetical protein